jgi:hypothetical protein
VVCDRELLRDPHPVFTLERTTGDANGHRLLAKIGAVVAASSQARRGNTSGQDVLAEVKDDMRDWWPGRVITVVDRGFSSAGNLAYLRRAGGHFIAGEYLLATSDPDLPPGDAALGWALRPSGVQIPDPPPRSWSRAIRAVPRRYCSLLVHFPRLSVPQRPD